MLSRILSSKFYVLIYASLCVFSMQTWAVEKSQEFSDFEFVVESPNVLEKIKELPKENEADAIIESLEQQNNIEPIDNIEKIPAIKDNSSIQPLLKPEIILTKTPETEKISLAPDDKWLLVDTKTMLLEVKQGDKTLAVFEGVAIGRNGSGFKNKRGDDITPLGRYKIGWVNKDSPFRTFYGFTYPSIKNAQEALKKGLIKQPDYDAIENAHQNNQVPPQNTPLGGRIGLHGLGKGDINIHRALNWTHGCIAVTNEQIDQLGRWIREGMEIQVK